MNEWQPIETAPENTVVMTKIDDGQGVRNEQSLKRCGQLWFFPDGSMYVYYTPTHWCELESTPQSANAGKEQSALDPKEEHQKEEEYLKLLVHAAKLIRTFHGIPLPERDEKRAWEIYYQKAPEMKPLREALEKAGVKL